MFPRNLFLAILSGGLLILAFPKFSQGWLVWVAVSPLILVCFYASPKRAFLYGFLSGTIFFGGLLYWLLSLEPWAGLSLSILAWVALTLAEALTFGFFAAGASLISKNYATWGRLILIPAWWVSLEFLRSIGPWSFSWGVLGISQTSSLMVLKLAKMLGVFGLSYLILLVNQTLTELFWPALENIALKASTPKTAKLSLRPLSVLVAVFFLVIGANVPFPREKSSFSDPFKVALIQGNIPQEQKWDEGKAGKIESVYFRETLKLKEGRPFLVIWPETAVPGFLFREQEFLKKIRFLAKELKSYLLVGSLDLDRKDRQYNSAFLFSPRGEVTGRYDKIKLVLFGEYVPPWPIFSNVKAVAGLGDNISPGRKITLFKTNRGKFGAVICFESANSFLVREAVSKGSKMIVVLTNDAWFGKTAAAAQHLDMLRIRAAENGVYALQIANTGVTAVISPEGEVLKKTALFKKAVINGQVALAGRKTFYTRFGYLFPHFILFIGLGQFLILIKKKF